MAFSWASALRITLLLLLLAAVIAACFTLPIEKMMKDFLLWVDHDLGAWGPLVLAVAYIPLTVLAVPASVLTLGGGYLFGLPVGFVADSIGATVGAGAAFLLGRTIGRSFVVSRLKDYPQFRSVAIAIQRSGFKIVLLLRLVPLLPFNMLNYLLSVTPVSIGEYMLASWLGMMDCLVLIGYLLAVTLLLAVYQEICPSVSIKRSIGLMMILKPLQAIRVFPFNLYPNKKWKRAITIRFLFLVAHAVITLTYLFLLEYYIRSPFCIDCRNQVVCTTVNYRPCFYSSPDSIPIAAICQYLILILLQPITLALVYVGTTLKDLSDVTHGWSEFSKTRWAFIIFGLVISVVLMICVTKVAKSALDKALAENEDIDGTSSPELPIAAEPSPHLNQPLIIKIDSAQDNHEK